MEKLQAETDFDLNLCDFGYSKDVKKYDPSSYLTGNQAFVAPEQMIDDREDKDFKQKKSIKSDVFSVGAMFLHFLHPILNT